MSRAAQSRDRKAIVSFMKEIGRLGEVAPPGVGHVRRKRVCNDTSRPAGQASWGTSKPSRYSRLIYLLASSSLKRSAFGSNSSERPKREAMLPSWQCTQDWCASRGETVRSAGLRERMALKKCCHLLADSGLGASAGMAMGSRSLVLPSL